MGKWSTATEERPKLLKNNFAFGNVKFSFTGKIPVLDWLATATGNLGVEQSSDLFEPPGVFPCSGPGLWMKYELLPLVGKPGW